MTAAAAGLTMVGALVQAKGARAQAKGQATAARFNAEVQRRNAKAADIQAEHNLLIAKIEQREQVRRFGELQGGLRVAYSKSGVMSGTGTARLVAEENARQFDEEQAARMMQAETNSQAMREKGVNARLSADLQNIYARNYITAGKYQAMGALFSGASRTASLLA